MGGLLTSGEVLGERAPDEISAQKETFMNLKVAAALLVSASLCTVTFAQNVPAHSSTPEGTNSGGGRRGYLAKFAGPHQINDSNIIQSSTGNIGVGTIAPIFPVHVYGTNNVAPAGQCCPITSFVENSAFADGTTVIALEGLASAGTGSVQGVNGTTFSPQGIGVFGSNNASTGNGGGGVIGITNSADFGFSFATRGSASASTGSAVAFFGETFSPDGTAGYFLNRAGGNIIVGHVGQNDDQSVFRVDGTGRVFADGGFQPNGADFAESMGIAGDRGQYSAGDLLAIDPDSIKKLAVAHEPYSTLVAGIYSTKPGMLGSTRKVNEPEAANEIPLAVVGIVPCKVTAQNGPIAAGDLLVASSIPGRAMKGTDRTRMLGAVVGKALEPLPTGVGVIQVLVTLQ